MRYLMSALVGALFFLIATPQTAVLSQPAIGGPECYPVQRVVEYLEQRRLDYVIIIGPAIQAWRDYLIEEHNFDIDSSQIIVALNQETGKGLAMFVAEGAVCLTLDFEDPPVKLHRS